MPKRIVVPVTVLGIFLAMTLPQAADAPSAIIPRTHPVPAAAAQSPTAPGATEAAATATPPAKHTVTVKFDYDFSRSPACSPSVSTNCVQQFNVYDISGGTNRRITLFSIPVPPNSRGKVRDITGTSPRLSFELGIHFLAVTAQPTAGNESDPAVCTTTVQIKP